ncbi:MAG: hypothetical protein ACHQ01_01005 [Candidatus Limnocylindrales bacterium]
MAKYETSFTLPAPLMAVVPAAALAAVAVGKRVAQQTPQVLVAKGGWLRLIGYPVDIRLELWGSDGAAIVKVVGNSFMIGPIQGWACRNDVDKFCAHLVGTLQQWAAQAQTPAAAPPAPANL